MRNVIVLGLFLLMGCNGLNKLTGVNKASSPQEKPNGFYILACCTDSNGGYPSKMPSSQVQLCNTAKHAPDNQINGDTYLPMSVDCLNVNEIGHEYYN